MTIAAGFICKDGILLCADREESSGASIKAVEKLVTLHVSPWTMTVATAGSGPAGDPAVKRLQKAFFDEFIAAGTNVRTLENKHEQIIIDVLTKIHEEHIWKNPRTDHAIKLVIGISFQELDRHFLYLTEDNIPQPINGYCCTGYGADLCTYFSERLYRSGLSKDEMILLASFIFREVNSAVQFCGKGTDMMLLRHTGLPVHIHPHGVEAIQQKIPEFAKAMVNFWDGVKALPDWLTSIGKVSQNAQEENTEPGAPPFVF